MKQAFGGWLLYEEDTTTLKGISMFGLRKDILLPNDGIGLLSICLFVYLRKVN